MNLTNRFSRIAIEIEEKGPGVNWLSIGHGRDLGEKYPPWQRRDRVTYLWIWNRGTLEVSEPLSTKDEHRTHSGEFPEIEDQSTQYYGRYDPDQELISVMIPNNRRFRGVPEIIKSSLAQQFPSARKIIVYTDSW